MAPSAILRRHFSGEPLDQATIDWLKRQGAPISALAWPVAAMAHAVHFGGGRFEFERCRASDEAQRAIVFPGFNEFGDLADLVAWHPKTGALGTWLGRVAMLGEEQVFGPRLGEPLVVHADPSAWLRAERQGVVIVDPRLAGSLLRTAGPLGAADRRQARRLRDILTVRLPTIVILDQGRPAA